DVGDAGEDHLPRRVGRPRRLAVDAFADLPAPRGGDGLARDRVGRGGGPHQVRHPSEPLPPRGRFPYSLSAGRTSVRYTPAPTSGRIVRSRLARPPPPPVGRARGDSSVAPPVVASQDTFLRLPAAMHVAGLVTPAGERAQMRRATAAAARMSSNHPWICGMKFARPPSAHSAAALKVRPPARRTAQGGAIDLLGPSLPFTLAIDDRLLRGGDAAGEQIDVLGGSPADQRERDRPEFVVLTDGGDGTDLPFPCHDVVARFGEGVFGTIEVEEHQAPGRFAHVEHPRDRFLPLVAPLVQV